MIPIVASMHTAGKIGKLIARIAKKPKNIRRFAKFIAKHKLGDDILKAISKYSDEDAKIVKKIKKLLDNDLYQNWHKDTFDNRLKSIQYHLSKHGKGRSAAKYTENAMSFFNKNKSLGKKVILKDGTEGIKIQMKKVINEKTVHQGGYWTADGKLVTF